MQITRMLAVLCALMASQAWAQQSDFCLEVAKRGLFDKYAGRTFNAGYAQSQSAYCKRFNETKNSNTSLGIGSGDLSLDFSQPDARATAELVCASNFDESKFEQSSASVARVLGNNAVEAIRACASSTGLVIHPRFEGDDLLVVDVAYMPTLGESVPSRKITAPIKVSGAIICEGTLADATAGTTVDIKVKTMICTRQAAAATLVEGVYGQSKVYPGGTATIITDAGSVSVSLPRKVDGALCAPQPVFFPNPPAPDMSNLCRACIKGYGDVFTDTLTASGRGNLDLRRLTYRVQVPNCGDYKLVAKYAAAASRPVNLILDGNSISTSVFARTTGGWIWDNQAEFVELILPLRAGQHVFRFERQDAFPHLASVELMPNH